MQPPVLQHPVGHRVSGRIRHDHKTKLLTQRLHPGDIAVVDHEDLDETAARALLARGVRAVIDVRPFLTGRFANPGPAILIDAGVPLIEADGDAVFGVNEGATISFDGERLLWGDRFVSSARQVTYGEVAEKNLAARDSESALLTDFVGNTLAFADREKDLILKRLEIPPLRTAIRGRQALVVVRGRDHVGDLAAIRGYIRDVSPVMIAVDGGADALLRYGLVPHMIIGDMDSVSDRALRSGAELIVHAYPDGRAPGLGRLAALGLAAHVIPAAGTSEDLALLVAFEQGAELIVAVGTHVGMDEFLAKGRPGMASTLLTRMKVGGILVDAKGVGRLHSAGVGWKQITGLLVSGVATMVLIFMTAPSTQALGRLIWIKIRYMLSL